MIIFRSSNIEEKELLLLSKIVGRCYSVKSFDYKFLELKGIPTGCDRSFSETQRRHIQLEELKIYLTAQGIARGNIENGFNLKYFRADRLKRLHIGAGFAGEWSFINEDKEICVERFLNNLSQYKNIREISMKLLKHPTEAQIALRVTACYAKFIHLHHLSLEFIGCPFTDMEATAISYGVSQMTYLKRFTLKIIQHPHLSEECILESVSLISNNSNLVQFDIYLRRLNITEADMVGFVEKLLLSSKNINCSYFKGSLHIFRKPR